MVYTGPLTEMTKYSVPGDSYSEIVLRENQDKYPYLTKKGIEEYIKTMSMSEWIELGYVVLTPEHFQRLAQIQEEGHRDTIEVLKWTTFALSLIVVGVVILGSLIIGH